MKRILKPTVMSKDALKDSLNKSDQFRLQTSSAPPPRREKPRTPKTEGPAS